MIEIDESLYFDSFGFFGLSQYTVAETFYQIATVAYNKKLFEFPKGELSLRFFNNEYLEIEFDGDIEALSKITGFPDEVCYASFSVYTTFFDVKTTVVFIISSNTRKDCGIEGILYLGDILKSTSSVIEAIKGIGFFIKNLATSLQVHYLVVGLDGYRELWDRENNFLCPGLVGVYEKEMLGKILGDRYKSFFENIPTKEIDGYLLIWSLGVEAFLRGERVTSFMEEKFRELSKLYDQAYSF